MKNALNAGNMRLHTQNNVEYLTFPALEGKGVRHAFSTRHGGVSTGPHAGMNLCFGRGDSDENVRENFRIFCAATGLEAESLVAAQQTHGVTVRRVTEEDRGKGLWRPRDYTGVDALITDDPHVTLVTYFADCVPIFFADPIHHAVGLAHAGWRGTVAGIARAAAQGMAQAFGTSPRQLLAAVGPSIGPCCFEVGPEVAEAFLAPGSGFPASVAHDDGNGKHHVDLWECNRLGLLAAGLRAENISVANLCTLCNHEDLYSHRALGETRGGLAAFITAQE